MEEWINVIVGIIAGVIIGFVLHSSLGHSNPKWYQKIQEFFGYKPKKKIPLATVIGLGMILTNPKFQEIIDKVLTIDRKNQGEKEGE